MSGTHLRQGSQFADQQPCVQGCLDVGDHPFDEKGWQSRRGACPLTCGCPEMVIEALQTFTG